MSLIKNEPLLYRFGFVCMPASELPSGGLWQELQAEWKSIQIRDLLVLAHPETPVTPISDSALLLGHTFAVEDNRSAQNLLETAIGEGSESALHEMLDTLSGRFALITSQERVYHDAVGARTVFYRTGQPPCIASHSGLIAGLFGATADPLAEAISREPEYASRSVVYLPGDLSMHDGIRALVPNNYYDISSGRTVRYWPRAPREKSTLGRFYSCADAYFESFAAYLSDQRLTPVLGVTAGLDTRAIIAAFRHHELPTKYVTWRDYALPKQDLPLIRKIVSYLGGSHEFLPGKGQEDDESFRRVTALAEKNVGYSGERPDIPAYMYQECEGQRDLVFVRGHGGGLIRGGPYNLTKAPIGETSVAELVRVYNSSIRTKSPPSHRYIKLASEAVEQFMVRANYEGLDGFGYDIDDLYPWESRLGMWGGSLHNEMDAAMLSITGFNSRNLFESAFGLETSERLDERFLLELTRRYDEGLAGFAVNPSKARSRTDGGASQSNRQLRGNLKVQRERIQVFKERLAKRDAKLKKVQEKRREAEQERDRLRRLYADIEQSRSWKYTLPVRKIVGTLKRLLRG
jgi:hypothetical protein